MKKRMLLWMLLTLVLALTGCASRNGQDAAPAPTASPTPPPQSAPDITASGALGDAARALMAPYQGVIRRAAEKSPVVLTYAIPGDLINKIAQDASAAGAESIDGRYHFSWHQSENHKYTADAGQVSQIETAAEHTPDPLSDTEPVLDNQQMGDFTAAGGGLFDRVCQYDVAENLTDGSAEFTETLNGALSGHELFSFAVSDGRLYFIDAILDQAVDLDGLTATEQYLVAAGMLGGDSLEIMEFAVPTRDQVPGADQQSWSQLLSQGIAALTRLTVQGNTVTVTP